MDVGCERRIEVFVKNDVLKICSRCEVFCKFHTLVTKMASVLIGIIKVNFNVCEKGPPLGFEVLIQNILINYLILQSYIFL